MSDCIGCSAALPAPFLDLGETPLANSYVSPEKAQKPEPRYPLAVAYCPQCHLVQLTHRVPPEEMFSEYLYFSSYSDTVVQHARRMVDSLTQKFSLGPSHRVLEIASNDGYLLQFFKQKGIQVLGVEPAANIAEVAVGKSIPTLNRFFGPQTVEEIRGTYGAADIIIGNNVLAHVPEINLFLTAVAQCLSPQGHASFEFPYLKDLLDHREFDTIYHEHVSYFSLSAIQILARRNGLKLFDVEHHPIHGGSVRVFLGLASNDEPVSPALAAMLAGEEAAGLTTAAKYRDFSREVGQLAETLVKMLSELRAQGKRIAGYGAPAKGNTLLNFCRIGTDLIEFTVDRSPYKQGLLLPGSRIPIHAPEALLERKPDYAVILPWNIAKEIVGQQQEFLNLGGQFIVPVPSPAILSPSADNTRTAAVH